MSTTAAPAPIPTTDVTVWVHDYPLGLSLVLPGVTRDDVGGIVVAAAERSHRVTVVEEEAE